MFPQRLAHYEITEKIGAGGMGEVYRALDSKLGRDVALKILPDGFANDEERLARFEREAKLLASLSHPSIGSIFGLENAGGYRFLVLEIVEGEDLSERLRRGRIPVEDAITIAKQVADALEAAHDQGIIHRDLKPSNIKVDPNGKVKVLDFGLGKAIEGERASQDLSHSPTVMASSPTMAGVILGTAAYMSPEQARGKPVDRRADIWAFGVVLYEMLTGRQLFEGETISDTLAAVIRADLDLDSLPSDTPVAIRSLLERCLDRDPTQRLRDIGEARIVIGRILSGDANANITIADATRPETAAGAAAGKTPVKRTLTTYLPWLVVAVVTAGSLLMLARHRAPVEPVIRAYLPPPKDSNYYLDTQHPGPVALSPDGSKVAFTAPYQGEVTLWVREIDALEARPLPSTEGAGYPFWSPDSRTIGFFDAAKLKRVDAAGGPPLAVCNASGGKGGSWNRDGTIVFAPTAGSAIHKVRASGGEPVAITAFDRENKENSHRFPQFLPDGEHFLYFARAGENSSIRVGSLGGDVNVEIARCRAQGWYAEGYLLFLREQTLMAQPLDLSALKLTGEAAPVATDVQFISSIPLAVFSVSQNGVMVYQTGDAEPGGFMRWRGRDGEPIETVGEAAPFGDFQLSPDEKDVCIEINDDALSTADLWIYDFETNIRTRFTFDPSNDYDPVWSPDGSEIIFCSDRTGQYDLYRKAVTGGEDERRVYESAGEKHAYDWSPDGRYVLFQETDSTQVTSVWALDLEQGKASRVTEPGTHTTRRPSFSPDGRWVVYAATEGTRRPVYVQSFPNAGRKWQVSSGDGIHPRWAGSGNIYYQTLSGDVMEVSLKTKPGSVQLGGESMLFNTRAQSEYHVGDDGQRFLEIYDRSTEKPNPAVLVVNWTGDLEPRR